MKVIHCFPIPDCVYIKISFIVCDHSFMLSFIFSFFRFPQEGYCHCSHKNNCSTVQFTRMMTTPKKNEEALRRGLAWYGPASIAINANRKSFKFYSSGVLDDPKCGMLSMFHTSQEVASGADKIEASPVLTRV